MTALGLRRGTGRFALLRTQIRRPVIRAEARWVWLAVLLFVAMSFWWLTQDNRVPDWDSGAHEYSVYLIRTQISQGHLTDPFAGFYTYPPLVYIVGLLSTAVAGFHPMALILGSNVVFVPLLAFGCYGVGRIGYGPRAGVLAAVLALGSPMFVSMMHEYELDPPQAAMVAVSVWAILASRRFERIGLAAAAGVLCGLTMLTKETSVFFLGGLLVVVVLRGGWRNWVGLLVFLFALENVAAPWYIYHWHDLHGLVTAFTSTGNGTSGGFSLLAQPARFSLRNFGWYGWDLVNQIVLAPFALVFLIGAALAVTRLVRRRIAPESVEPELLGGLLISYLGVTYLTLKDPRYALPMLVYVAVLATGWIANLTRPGLRRWLSVTVVALATVYFVGVSTGTGSDARISLPGAQNNVLHQWQLTLYEADGYVRAGPQSDGDVPALMDGLRRAGIRGISIATGPNPIDFNNWGLMTLAVTHGLLNGDPSVPATQQASLILGAPGLAGPPPCQRLLDGSGIYVVRGPAPGLNLATLRNPADPRQRYTFICPGRPPLLAP
jgi:4-amino-4-deoxy-L-arabinose transferase-like glycosyltransferase